MKLLKKNSYVDEQFEICEEQVGKYTFLGNS